MHGKYVIRRHFPFQIYLPLGLCVRSKPDVKNYNKHGVSNKCFEGENATLPCTSGSKLCGGRDTEANYVYKITIPGK